LYQVFWRLVERYRIAAMSAVPTVYAVLGHVPVDADISSLAYPLVGAAPLPESVRHRFAEHTGVDLVEGYGLTEATCVSARSFLGDRRPGAIGCRLPYQRIKAVRIDPGSGAWTDLPPGEPGVLAISGPTVFPGYLGENGTPDPACKVVDGWLDTGDLGYVDDDGYVHLTGRAKDLIIRGGHNIDPSGIEDALLTHPSVAAAAAVGRPDPHAGEVPVAYVSLHPGSTATPAELSAWAADRVAERAAHPKEIHIIDTIPVTQVGKQYKPALRHDATRRVVEAELDALATTGTVKVDEEGRIEVTVTDSSTVDKVAEALRRYTFIAHVTTTPPTSSRTSAVKKPT
jgi:fatty-acyl-CoA synthase